MTSAAPDISHREPRLLYWHDEAFRPPAMQMALDEALFDFTREQNLSAIRFYCWDRPAVTVGYFHQRQEAEAPPHHLTGGVPWIKRWTGGGLVEHGEDVTFCLTLASGSPVNRWDGTQRYHWIHQQLGRTLQSHGIDALLGDHLSASSPGPCFLRPVPYDLLSRTGEKIAGGAQRRSKGALIHQGSVRVPPDARNAHAEWTRHLVRLLSLSSTPLDTSDQEHLLAKAAGISRQRYETAEWNQTAGMAPSPHPVP